MLKMEVTTWGGKTKRVDVEPSYFNEDRRTGIYPPFDTRNRIIDQMECGNEDIKKFRILDISVSHTLNLDPFDRVETFEIDEGVVLYDFYCESHIPSELIGMNPNVVRLKVSPYTEIRNFDEMFKKPLPPELFMSTLPFGAMV